MSELVYVTSIDLKVQKVTKSDKKEDKTATYDDFLKASGKNQLNVQYDIEWLSKVIDYRLAEYLDNEPSLLLEEKVPIPELKKGGNYQEFIQKHGVKQKF